MGGERGPKYQRMGVLPLHREDGLARREACGLRQRDKRHGRGEGNRESWLGERQDVEEGRDRGLWSGLSETRPGHATRLRVARARCAVRCAQFMLELYVFDARPTVLLLIQD